MADLFLKDPDSFERVLAAMAGETPTNAPSMRRAWIKSAPANDETNPAAKFDAPTV